MGMTAIVCIYGSLVTMPIGSEDSASTCRYLWLDGELIDRPHFLRTVNSEGRNHCDRALTLFLIIGANLTIRVARQIKFREIRAQLEDLVRAHEELCAQIFALSKEA